MGAVFSWGNDEILLIARVNASAQNKSPTSECSTCRLRSKERVVKNVSIPSLLLGGAGGRAGSAELSKHRSDLAQLEQGAVADVKSRVTALENDVAALKKSVPSAPAAGVLAAPAP
jgi:hypothetical protein